MIIETKSAKETYDLGKKIGSHAKAGEVYTLVGDLGVGKTVFTQGLAKGLGIEEPISSPTFTIVQVYDDGRLPFYHFDVYRIGDIEEMDEIGFEDYVYGDGVSLIEWANLIDEILPANRTEITIEKDLEQGFDFRRITVEKRGEYMRILAIDSSGLVATVAVVEEENEISKTIAEYTINYKKTHSQTLLPMLDEIVKMTDMNLDTIDAIAVAGGPGSFTGLRIGSATAKGLGLALKKPLIHIPTVDGLAYNLCYTDRIICPIMDARRNQVYTGIYQMDGDKLQVLEAQMAVEIDELAKKLCSYGKPVIFLGDGVPVHKDRLEKELMMNYDIAFAPAHMNQQRAAAVGMLGIQYYKEGKTETAMEHKPDYLRVSQAEREREEPLKAEKTHE